MDAAELKKLMTRRDEVKKRASIVNDRIGRLRKTKEQLIAELKAKGIEVEGKPLEELEKLALDTLTACETQMGEAEQAAQTILEAIGER